MRPKRSQSEIAILAKNTSDQATAQLFDDKASQRRAAMNRLLWDDENGTYCDYDWQLKRRCALNAACVTPLFVGMASAQFTVNFIGRSRAFARSLHILQVGFIPRRIAVVPIAVKDVAVWQFNHMPFGFAGGKRLGFPQPELIFFQ